MKTRKLLLPLFLLLLTFQLSISQNPGDEVVIQTFEYDGFPVGNGWLAPREGFFDFTAADGLDYEKVLIYYNLKCDPNQNPNCGEWDYLSYTKIIDHTGRGEDPSYIIGGAGGFSPDTYSYMNDVSWQYSSRFEESIVYTNPGALTSYTVGTGASTMTNPLDGSLSDAKNYYIIRASELTAAGLSSGDITGIQFNVDTAGDEMHNLKMGLKSTALTSLDTTIDQTGFTEVYSKDTAFTGTGWQQLDFTSFFNWDGSSNLLVEISYTGKDGVNPTLVLGDTYAFNCGLDATSQDNYLEFNGPDAVKIPVDNMATIGNEITVSFWANGNGEQPQADSVFEALDDEGRRVLNVHLPWDNGRIYWDAGNDTGYDRIEKDADNTSQYKGTWNHWAFTKNATSGEMKIFLNGVLWHSGTGLMRDMAAIEKFAIGNTAGDNNNDRFYDGKLDDFTVWNTELDEATIAAWMRKDIDATHPNYSNLMAYYKFDATDPYNVIEEISSQNVPLNGIPARRNFEGNRFKNFATSTERPQMRLNRNTSTFNVTSQLVVDSIPNSPVLIEKYAQIVADAKPVLNESLYKYPTYYNNYVYDAMGIATDSTLVAADETITLDYISYATTDPADEILVPWEISRYITPYGNGLSLGDDGWTWVFDVTDFQHLLQGDNVHIRAGNFQELLDMKVVFEIGTPARDVIAIENLYSGNYQLSDFDARVVNTTVDLHPDAEMFSLKTTVTGHGFGSGANCGEFCNNTHSVDVNGVEQFSWEIMQECGENPLYPQGGTWMYDRAGWCPGAGATVQNLDVTPFINVGSDTTVDVDYNVEADPFGNYVTEIFFVNYNEPNFTVDASIEEIIAPNIFKLNTRFNPTCGQPIIKIKNTGTQELTSLTITYGIDGGDDYTFQWTGSLAFLAEEIVTLPAIDVADYYEGTLDFVATLSAPNGAVDEYEFNNEMTSQFELAPIHDQQLIVEFKTNNRASQNSYKVFDAAGNEVFERSGFSNNTVYTDLVNLPPGCYKFVAYDTGGDGMNNWPSNHGNGYIRLKNLDGTNITELERWFGESISYYFRNDAVLGTNDVPVVSGFSLYPNPATSFVTVELLNSTEDFTIEMYSITGALVSQTQVKDTNKHVLDTSALSSGIYMVHLKTEHTKQVQKLIVE